MKMAKNPDTSANGASSEKKAIFEQYAKLDKAANVAKKALETAMEARSECVSEIIERYGKGPFKYEGMIYTGVIRVTAEEKDEKTDRVITPAKRTAFFKSPGSKELQEV
jgi:hypothetical protein